MSASKAKVNKKLSPPQKARDIRAVILSTMVDHLITHEAPTSCLLPDTSEMFDWSLNLVEVFETRGLEAAAGEFEASLIGYDAEGVPACAKPEPWNQRNFWENEFPILLGYVPGHHQGFEVETTEFLPYFLNMLGNLAKRRSNDTR
ncbi:hypothetical protein QQZ08_004081 [Neonectria magnoliae]|uniref:Uncharacterized protein n=1 Tax=Neonectria magnoliae TaxID=2732573 RepID=A0ABR1I7A9_9HYPO